MICIAESAIESLQNKNTIILRLFATYIYTGCAKKKKDILNIYVKSQIINIFYGKLGC